MAKRFVRKVNEIIWNSGVADTQYNHTIYTCPNGKRETMVGLKGNVTVTHDTTVSTQSGRVGITISKVPNDQPDPVLDLSGNTEISTYMNNVVWSWFGYVDEGNSNFISIPLDIKTMRKMQEADKLVFSWRSEVSTGNFNALIGLNSNVFLLES